MILTVNIIKSFEREQKAYGTDVALSNFIWVIASDMLRSIGVKKVSTTYEKRAKGQILKGDTQ